MASFARTYDVHGMVLRVVADSPALAETLDGILRPFAVDRRGRKGFLLRITYGSPKPVLHESPRLRRLGRWRHPGDFWVVYYAGSGARELRIPRLARWCVNLARRTAEVTIKPGAERCLRTHCTTLVLCEFLAQVGQHVVHAASLVTRNVRPSQAVLLSGVSGLGKSTAALALARSGMTLMADDATFVGASDGNAPLKVWGLPRPLKVHRRTVTLMPWLRRLPLRAALEPDEYLLDVRHIAQKIITKPVRAGLILFLEPRNRCDHRLTPLDKMAALMRLTRENVRAVDARAEGAAGRAFLTLARLVEQCQTYRLSVGPRLETLHDRVVALLGAIG